MMILSAMGNLRTNGKSSTIKVFLNFVENQNCFNDQIEDRKFPGWFVPFKTKKVKETKNAENEDKHKIKKIQIPNRCDCIWRFGK